MGDVSRLTLNEKIDSLQDTVLSMRRSFPKEISLLFDNHKKLLQQRREDGELDITVDPPKFESRRKIRLSDSIVHTNYKDALIDINRRADENIKVKKILKTGQDWPKRDDNF